MIIVVESMQYIYTHPNSFAFCCKLFISSPPALHNHALNQTTKLSLTVIVR